MVVHDTVGGPVGVGVAEWLAGCGRDVALVTADQIAGTLLSLSGDLADANTRLQRAGVRREMRAVLRRLSDGQAHLEDPWTGATWSAVGRRGGRLRSPPARGGALPRASGDAAGR